jgi:hypothetical protein
MRSSDHHQARCGWPEAADDQGSTSIFGDNYGGAFLIFGIRNSDPRECVPWTSDFYI